MVLDDCHGSGKVGYSDQKSSVFLTEYIVILINDKYNHKTRKSDAGDKKKEAKTSR